MNSCELVSAISALAYSIAKDKTNDELSILAAIFTQLGDTLTTIAVSRNLNKNQGKCENKC